MRVERFDHVGELAILVAHAMAHVEANPHDLSDDSDPRFIQHFFRNFRACGQGLFLKASELEREAKRLDGAAGKAAANAVAAAAAAERRASGAGNATPAMNVDDPNYFTLHNLRERVGQYQAFLARPRLSA